MELSNIDMRNIPLKYHQALTHLIATAAHTNQNNVKSIDVKQKYESVDL